MSKRVASSTSLDGSEGLELATPPTAKQPKMEMPSEPRDACMRAPDKGVEKYNMEHKFRGHAVIFRQGEYKKCLSPQKRCLCSNKEVDRLTKTFKNLGFKVFTHKDLSLQDINEKIRKLAEETDHTDADCLVVVMLTHGTRNNFLTNKRSQGFLTIQELWMPFCGTKCPSLAGKPKLFFIETCKEETTPQGAKICGMDVAKPPNSQAEVIPNCADFLIVYNSIQGTNHPDNECSWFVETMCRKLEKLSPQYDLLTILTRLTSKTEKDSEVNLDNYEDFWMNKTPHINSTLTKYVYFSD